MKEQERMVSVSKSMQRSGDQQKLETIINQTLKTNNWEAACVLADKYLAQYGDVLTYEHYLVLGNVFFQGAQYEKSHDMAIRAIKQDADRHDAPELLFWVKFQVGDSQADEVLDRLIEDGPEDRKKTYLYWAAIRANNQSNYPRILELIDLAGGPPSLESERYSEVMFAYIAALCEADRIEEAQQYLDNVPQDKYYASPNFPMISAHILRSRGDIQAVAEHYTAVLEKFPDLVEAKWNRALARLECGDLKNGWEDYECRYQWSGFPSPEKLMDAPRWSGEDLSGKTILLWAEQGIGDQIMFLSLALPLLQDPSVSVRIEVHPKIVQLVRTWYPEAQVQELNTNDARGNPAYADIDFNLPVGSLPKYFLATKQQLRERPIRYLKSDQQLRQSLLSGENSGEEILVGICWRSSMINHGRVGEYLNVEAVKTIARNLNQRIKIVSLQYGITDDEKAALAEHHNVFIPDVDFFENVSEHARYISACDYVVAPKTSTIQLAGIFNKNTFSWGITGWSFLGQRQYPWYPSVAFFALSRNFSQSSLVHQISRWLNLVASELRADRE